MKMKSTLLLAGTAGIALTGLQARNDEHGEGTSPRPHSAPPLIMALDTDGDGVISMMEIANAAQSLLLLDAKDDGELTHDEIHPRPEGDKKSEVRGSGRRDREESEWRPEAQASGRFHAGQVQT